MTSKRLCLWCCVCKHGEVLYMWSVVYAIKSRAFGPETSHYTTSNQTTQCGVNALSASICYDWPGVDILSQPVLNSYVQGHRYGFWAPWTAYSLGPSCLPVGGGDLWLGIPRDIPLGRNRYCVPEPVCFPPSPKSDYTVSAIKIPLFAFTFTSWCHALQEKIMVCFAYIYTPFTF